MATSCSLLPRPLTIEN